LPACSIPAPGQPRNPKQAAAKASRRQLIVALTLGHTNSDAQDLLI